MSLLGEVLVLVPLDVLPPTATPGPPGSEVDPQQAPGRAAYLIGGFIGLGVLIVAMVLLSLKPRRADPGDQVKG